MTNRAIDRFMGKPDPKQEGRRAEDRFARRTGGRATPASGAGGSKGDVIVGDYMVEHKSTVAGSMSIKLQWLRKVAHEARLAGKTPALAVCFDGDRGPVPDGAWVMVTEEEWRRLTGVDQG